ncbi:hypothetical protein [Roseisalinus antarcticus]|uniref:hypothetical protein n=1 Tax=Roseisalinus antarcticus TaxID=254357 RepID=UPI00117B2DE0|nr:hypothetical protein [Roseisalinus antarcticus]
MSFSVFLLSALVCFTIGILLSHRLFSEINQDLIWARVDLAWIILGASLSATAFALYQVEAKISEKIERQASQRDLLSAFTVEVNSFISRNCSVPIAHTENSVGDIVNECIVLEQALMFVGFAPLLFNTSIDQTIFDRQVSDFKASAEAQSASSHQPSPIAPR